jgi:hypothetical protein
VVAAGRKVGCARYVRGGRRGGGGAPAPGPLFLVRCCRGTSDLGILPVWLINYGTWFGPARD